MSFFLSVVAGQGGISAPGAPGTLSLSNGSTSGTMINLSWSAPSDDGGATVTGYRIKKDGSTLVADTSSTGTTYTATGLTRLTEYNFNVAAINEVGTGDDGNTPTHTTTAEVPGAPGTLSLSNGTDSDTDIDLSWSAPSDTGGATVTGYKIEISTNSGGSWSTEVADTGSTGTTYDDTGLSGGTRYDYRVSAINSIGTGATGNEPNHTTTDTFAWSVTGSPTETAYSGYRSLYWTGSGSFVVTNAASTSVDVFVSAGGGSGGASDTGCGGGGTGGIRESTGNALSNTSYTVTIGAGGSSVNDGNGNNGSTSSFGSIMSNSGGGGGGGPGAGNSGGAGGGSGFTETGSGGSGTSGQGGDGGAGSSTHSPYVAGGGGGGKDGVDGNDGAFVGGTGGAGFNTNTYFDGSTDYYGGGGGGGGNLGGASGGDYHGGNGGSTGGVSATSNKGGGGGGAGNTPYYGGAGASGFVIIRWAE